jgi:hypothetical protein
VTTTKIPTAGAMALSILTARACIDPQCQCRWSLKEGRGLTHCPIPTHGRGEGDHNPSLNITVTADKCLWHCFAGCDQETLTEVMIALSDDAESFGSVEPKPFTPSKGKLKVASWWFDRREKVTAIYAYRDEAGTVLYEKIRYQDKDGSKRFENRRGPYGNPLTPSYYDKLGDVRRVPYLLPGLIRAKANQTIVMVEGEKAADRLWEMGFVATIYKEWRPEWNQFLTGRWILMLPDNDEAGEKYVADAVKVMWGAPTEIEILRLPGLPPGGDVYDFIEQGHGAVLLEAIKSP